MRVDGGEEVDIVGIICSKALLVDGGEEEVDSWYHRDDKIKR